MFSKLIRLIIFFNLHGFNTTILNHHMYQKIPRLNKKNGHQLKKKWLK
jgi:hypothetical protein